MSFKPREAAPQPQQPELLTPPKDLLLACYAQALLQQTYPGYPVHEERLFLDHISYDAYGHVTLDNSGPWVAGETLPSRLEQLTDVLHNIGYPKMCTLDADYRPLHPWWRDIVTRSDIGGVVGKGFYYYWGANYTADAAVIAHDENNTPHVLLIQRRDNGEWALPGGFLNPNEPSKVAAVRELHEETSLLLDRSKAGAHKIYSGPVFDIRTTLHACSETHLWVFTLYGNSLPDTVANDDAIGIDWAPLNNIPSELYGSHPLLIQMALNHALGIAEQQAGERSHR